MKSIPGFDGYCATEDGQIVSVREADPKVLKQRERAGYFWVTVAVQKAGRKQRHRMAVHRLVLMAYQGKPMRGANHGRHLDGNSRNNMAGNLAWGTPADNSQDALQHGTIGPGMRAHRRKLADEQVSEIRRRIGDGEATAALAREFGVSRYYPAELARGKRWSHLDG